MSDSLQNKTTIFNIYGITEVSSWAMCYQVTADDLASDTVHGHGFPSAVPLGSPLLGTRIELRDEDGVPVDKGSGFIWIGKSKYATAVPLILRHSNVHGHKMSSVQPILLYPCSFPGHSQYYMLLMYMQKNRSDLGMKLSY